MKNDNKHKLIFKDKDITLIGTAHVSKESANLVNTVIEQEKPDTVCIELCESRYRSIKQKNQWQDTDLFKVIREKKAFLLLSNLVLASFQKKIGKRLGIKPGQEIIEAINAAEAVNAAVHLSDRDIRVTLSRAWHSMSLFTKLKLPFQFLFSLGEVDKIKEEDIEEMKKHDVLENLLSELGQTLPELHGIIIDERDQYLAHKIRTAPGKRIVAVVGAGHVPGIKKYWDKSVDAGILEETPPKSRLTKFLKWGIPVSIVGLIALGFFGAGVSAGTQMIKWWILANAILAGLGAVIALAHPMTIMSAIISAPLTSLNPMIAAGWVAGLVEAFWRKPKVRDFERLPEDIISFKGFWGNRITRILMVVVFTNLGSSIGTFVAIPFMVKIFA